MTETNEAFITSDEPGPGSAGAGLILTLILLAISVFVLVYSVTRAFVWDEGYHLIAAQQISRGKLPYIDFCFPQAPLNAFLNAGIVHIFGEYWRPVHVFAALFSLGSVALTAQYIFLYFPVRRWRLACSLTAAIFTGLNAIVIQFGTIGQAYGIGLFFSVAAYRIAVRVVTGGSLLMRFACGLCAGVAAGSTLLTAPILPVFLLWLWFRDEGGKRLKKALSYLAGVAVAFAPVAWLFALGPRQTFFNVVAYHALYRRVAWPGATLHDIEVFSSWLDSTQALTLLLLAAAGLFFIRKQTEWGTRQRGDFYLAAWLTLALGAYICTPHPTFNRYFIFLTPFLTILAMAGLFAVGSRLGDADRPAWPAGIAAVLMALMLAKEGLQSREETTWQDYEKVIKKVAEITPKGGRIYADEVVYFGLQQSPPPSMELSYSHYLRLPPDQEKLLHIISEPEIKTQIQRGQFATVQTCSDPAFDRLGLPGPFAQRVDIEDCTVFWEARAR